MAERSVDVVIVGGGPAGLTVGGALARRGHSVALFERTAYGEPRVGETLGAEVFSLLETLGAGAAVAELALAHVPFRAVRAAWGSEEVEERASILHAHGEGRHVDRARFDQALAGWAGASGVRVLRDSGTCVAKPLGAGFRIEPTRGEPVTGRYFVDASGRGAPAGAAIGGRRWLALDRQVALVARVPAPRDHLGYDLVLESAEQGWWYSVPQPSGELVLVLITDADLAPKGDRRSLLERFTSALARTRHTAERCAGLVIEGPVRVVRADSGRLLPSRGRAWCAVGDAAMAGDPLAGNGVIRALRGAVAAVPRIDAELGGAPLLEQTAEAREAHEDRVFVDYVERRAEHYASEPRWPDAPFWQRRRAVAWQEAPITLAPTALLRRGALPARDVLAGIEALVPPRVIAHVLDVARDATPAHVMMTALREVAPLGDRRLLVGLQMLVAAGALTIS